MTLIRAKPDLERPQRPRQTPQVVYTTDHRVYQIAVPSQTNFNGFLLKLRVSKTYFLENMLESYTSRMNSRFINQPSDHTQHMKSSSTASLPFQSSSSLIPSSTGIEIRRIVQS